MQKILQDGGAGGISASWLTLRNEHGPDLRGESSVVCKTRRDFSRGRAGLAQGDAGWGCANHRKQSAANSYRIAFEHSPDVHNLFLRAKPSPRATIDFALSLRVASDEARFSDK